MPNESFAALLAQNLGEGWEVDDHQNEGGCTVKGPGETGEVQLKWEGDLIRVEYQGQKGAIAQPASPTFVGDAIKALVGSVRSTALEG